VSRPILGLYLCGLVLAGSAPGATTISGSWVGSYRLPTTADPVAITVTLHGRTATVALGPGHAAAQDVKVRAEGSRLRFSLPGLPARLEFSSTLRGQRLGGTVSQGLLRGTVQLTRGTSASVAALGLYRSGSGATVAVIQAEGLPTWLVELPDGRTHGLNAALTSVGTRLGETRGDGTLSVDRSGLTWTRQGTATRYDRVQLRQQEVRIGRLAGTLTIPTGRRPLAAAALVHGSGPSGREDLQTFAAYLESVGIAVLAADKRGIGESGGSFPGSPATQTAISALAADAQAQVRFLGTLPQVDRSKVGLLGASQAGWVIALAAARDRAVRWGVPLVGPTTTVGETDLFTQLAGAEQAPPSGTRAQMLAEVRAQGPSGFDPIPSLRKLTIPVLWVYGDDDRNVPTELCLERLRSVAAGHDFSLVVLPMTHALIDLPNGLYSSLRQSRGFNAGLFPALGEWLRSKGVAR
jgi:pimeloyl-ACP methyl ester carboxylesterase